MGCNNCGDKLVTIPAGPQGPSGENGVSAYEIWLGQGNEGSEQDFLDSLCECDEECQNVFEYLTYQFNIL